MYILFAVQCKLCTLYTVQYIECRLSWPALQHCKVIYIYRLNISSQRLQCYLSCCQVFADGDVGHNPKGCHAEAGEQCRQPAHSQTEQSALHENRAIWPYSAGMKTGQSGSTLLGWKQSNLALHCWDENRTVWLYTAGMKTGQSGFTLLGWKQSGFTLLGGNVAYSVCQSFVVH